jgi:CBS domain containing-hemolysin-like protein
VITTVVIPIVVIVVLVVVNGVFVAAEFALVGARPSRLQSHADGGSSAAKWLLDLFDRAAGKDSYIAVAQLGITLASIGLGMYGEPAVASWLYAPFEDLGLSYDAAHAVGFVVALSGITYLHVVLGEMIPKALALQAPEAVSLRLNPVMRLFGFLFRPMVIALNAVAFALMRLLRIPEPDKRLSLYTSAELAIVTDESADSGALGDMQRELIRNVFGLQERTAEELMTPRGRLEVIDTTASAAEILEQVSSSPRSRYPVVDGTVDRVVGVLHVKDVIRAQQREGSLVPQRLARPAPTVTARARADEVLELFQSRRAHAAIVVDEHGATLGLVTIDDIIAVVMDDEYRLAGHAPVAHDDGSLSIDGEVTLVELADELDIVIEHDDVTTLAGLVMALAGDIPEVGRTVSVDGYDLVVEERSGRKLSTIRIVPDATTHGAIEP